MMEKTSAHRIIADSSTEALIGEVQTELASKNHALEVTELPSLFDAFPCLAPKEEQRHYALCEPYPYSEPRSLDEVFMILHSSGSTGFPKPIPLRHDYTLAILLSRRFKMILLVTVDG
jgi:acyl-coenzyme A synthetase/AMP-(fatty) acid ligase